MSRKLVLEEDKGVCVEKTDMECSMCQQHGKVIYYNNDDESVAICLPCAEQIVQLLKPVARRRGSVTKK